MADQGGVLPAPNPNQQQLLIQDHTGQEEQVVHLNWSNFKPEFSEKPDGDAEVYLLHSNDWMNAHCIVDGVKVQRFCLTLLGEARLWYHSLEPINVDWPDYKICLGNDMQRYVTHENNYSMHGDPLILMKTQRP